MNSAFSKWTGIEAVKVDMRNMMTAQESFRRKHGRYTGDLLELLAHLASLYKPDRTQFFQHRIELHGDDRGYVATARNDDLTPGPSKCTVYVGAIDRPARTQPMHLITE